MQELDLFCIQVFLYKKVTTKVLMPEAMKVVSLYDFLQTRNIRM